MTQRKYSVRHLPDGFTPVPNIVLRANLTGNAKALYAIMLDNAWKKEEPELPELAASIAVGETTCRKIIRELVGAGLVVSKRRGQGLTNAYIVDDAPEAIQNLGIRGSRTSESEVSPYKDLLEDKGDIGAKAPMSAGTDLERQTRARNPVFDALVEATNANPADGGMIGKAAKSIRTAMEDTLRDLRQGYMAQNPHEDEVPKDVIDDLVATQIRIRADLYRRLRPEWELTPTALAKHWNRIPTWQPNTAMRPRDIAELRDEDFGVGR